MLIPASPLHMRKEQVKSSWLALSKTSFCLPMEVKRQDGMRKNERGVISAILLYLATLSGRILFGYMLMILLCEELEP